MRWRSLVELAATVWNWSCPPTVSDHFRQLSPPLPPNRALGKGGLNCKGGTQFSKSTKISQKISARLRRAGKIAFCIAFLDVLADFSFFSPKNLEKSRSFGSAGEGGGDLIVRGDLILGIDLMFWTSEIVFSTFLKNFKTF